MDIISLSVDIDRDKIDSRYRFAVAVIQRAKQLNQGAMPTKETKAKKIITLALEEVAAGTVRVLSGEEALKVREEAEKSACKHIIDEAGQKESHVEDMTELEKDVRGYLKEKREREEEYFPWESSWEQLVRCNR